MRERIDPKEKGMIALTTILIMGALMLSIGIGVTLRSLVAADMSSGEEFSARAAAFSDACAEIAILRLKSDLGYSGNETIIVEGADTCGILATEGTGNANRAIKTESTIGGYTRKTRVVLSMVTPLQIAEWRFVGDF